MYLHSVSAGRIAALTLLLTLVACQGTDRMERLFHGDLEVIDLTHSLSEKAPFWGSGDRSPFDYDTLAVQPSGAPSMGAYHIPEHFGTHLDAPIHGGDGQKSVDLLTPSELFGPVVVVDIVEKASQDADYTLTVQDLVDWEALYGRIPDGAIVLLSTGWSEKWDDADAYRNFDADGRMHFPGFSAESAEFLVEHRDIRGIGIDNMSVDAAAADGFPVHGVVNGSGRFHLESVANTHLLPPVGANLIVAPIKLEGGSGGQVRLFAILP